MKGRHRQGEGIPGYDVHVLIPALVAQGAHSVDPSNGTSGPCPSL